VLVLQEAHKRNQITRLMPFRKFRLQKYLELKEGIAAEDIVDSVSLFIPYGSDVSEQRLAASELTERLVQMAQVGSVSVIGIATQPDN
jgi:hypothetical protein